MTTETTTQPALTMLTEEEVMFRDAVRDFAQGEIQPKVEEMDHAHKYDESLVKSLFAEGQAFAEKQGLILADTKYELGLDEGGTLVVADEIHTPDSSRYWYSDAYEQRMHSR